jgi:ADP-ribose pyrophosphatase YjhB (NUDIX family)
VSAASPGSYCRHCGAAARRGVPAGDTRERAICEACGAVEYDNPKVVVSCALYEGDRILWVRRRTPPYVGGWAIPAGFLENGETIEEAAAREVREETLLRVEPRDLKLHGVMSLPDLNQVYIATAGPLPGHDYGPTPEASKVRMFVRAEIESLQIGYPPATMRLLLALYDSIGRGDQVHMTGRLWEMRGSDPAAR